ncbi:MAG: cupin domain-containing protein [Thermoanaerobaculia bacterium]
MATALESLLEISPIEFRERYYGKQPLLIRGNPRKFADLLTWDDLNRLLNSLSYPHEHVTAVVPERAEATTPERLMELCRAGATLRVAQLQTFEPKVGQLLRDLEAETGEPMKVTLFLSQASRPAVEVHYDLQDVLVLQIDGHKSWSVYEPTFDKPVPENWGGPDDTPGPLHMECELAPGDVLYLPRGYWHEALAQRGMSLHLTITMSARNGIDWLTWLAEQLRSDVHFRYELPLHFADEHVAELGEILRSRMADAGTVQSFMEHCAEIIRKKASAHSLAIRDLQ